VPLARYELKRVVQVGVVEAPPLDPPLLLLPLPLLLPLLPLLLAVPVSAAAPLSAGSEAGVALPLLDPLLPFVGDGGFDVPP